MARRQGGGKGVFERSYWREGDARAAIEAWQRSGQPLGKFASRHGVQPRRLSRWSRRLAQGKGRPVRFHPVRIVGAEVDRGEPIEVVLVDGLRVRVPSGFAAAELERLLAVLEGRG